MNEAQFQAEVIALCEKHSIVYHHCTDGRKCRGRRGFPDLVLVGFDDVLFVELKTTTGKLSDSQVQWKYDILKTGHRHEVWRPRDLETGVIDAILSNL